MSNLYFYRAVGLFGCLPKEEKAQSTGLDDSDDADGQQRSEDTKSEDSASTESEDMLGPLGPLINTIAPWRIMCIFSHVEGKNSKNLIFIQVLRVV